MLKRRLILVAYLRREGLFKQHAAGAHASVAFEG